MIHLKQMIFTMLDIFSSFIAWSFQLLRMFSNMQIFLCVYGYILQVVMTPLDYYNQRDSRKERTSLFIGSGFYEKYITADKCFSKIWYFTIAARELIIPEGINASYPKS